jgi:hypothetical protein
MDFRTWFENDLMTAQQSNAPASAEVIRSGLQPQVDAQEIKTSQKEEYERIAHIDEFVGKIIRSSQDINPRVSPRLKDIKTFCEKLARDWTNIKGDAGDGGQNGLGSFKPNAKTLQSMKNNQPPAEGPKAAGPDLSGAGN